MRPGDGAEGGGGRTHRPGRRRLLRGLGALAALALVAGCWACSPVYVVKAGLAEWRILRARQPIPEVLADPTTPTDTRDKLAFVSEARRFAADELEIDVGGAYSQYTALESDTLALVLSAAHRDRLASRTWWFPVVGHVPYKGFFDHEDAHREEAELQEEGFDTYLRPTAAFSTLGWFDDPVLSSMLRSDEIEAVETVLHELAHRYLFASGQVRFNESFATWVGRAGAVRFFCGRDGGGPDTVKCARAEARWRDYQRFGVFIDGLVAELQAVYADSTLDRDAVLERRTRIFDSALARFDARVQPTLESFTFGGFRSTPLNNATLLARMRYYHRLPDFAALQAGQGGLGPAMAFLRDGLEGTDDPFTLLPEAEPRRGVQDPDLAASPPGGSF